jgi:uncharacterized protein (UPF0303 family)
VTSLERLIREEQQLQLDRFDHDTVWALGVALVEAAQAAGAPLAIEIRRNGHQLFHAALHGTAPDNDAWLARKARVVDRFGHTSQYVGERARQGARRSRSRCAWTVAPTPRTAGRTP